MIRSIRMSVAMTLLVGAFALTPRAARAQSYTGRYAVTVSMSTYANGPYCITLEDHGDFGWPHSGSATLIPSEGTDNGAFVIINGLITVTFDQPSGTAEAATLIFTAPAPNSKMATEGSYEQFYGLLVDSGSLVFGTKDSCPFGQ